MSGGGGADQMEGGVLVTWLSSTIKSSRKAKKDHFTQRVRAEEDTSRVGRPSRDTIISPQLRLLSSVSKEQTEIYLDWPSR